MPIRIDRDGCVTVITIDRPESRNAIDRTTADALTAAVQGFDSLESQRVAVLTGAGGTFCSGADLKALRHGRVNRLEVDGDGPLGPSRLLTTKPVIAAIAGHAVAGGLELACWCDLRIVEESAVLGVFCRRWGVPLIDGGTVRLPRIIGLGRALDLILTGRAVTADEALQMGLATQVVPNGSALSQAVELAKRLGAFPQGALLADRLSAYSSFDGPCDEGIRREFERGLPTVAEGTVGAARFADGAGRSGSLE